MESLNDLKLLTLLPPPPEYCHGRYWPSGLVCFVWFINPSIYISTYLWLLDQVLSCSLDWYETQDFPLSLVLGSVHGLPHLAFSSVLHFLPFSFKHFLFHSLFVIIYFSSARNWTEGLTHTRQVFSAIEPHSPQPLNIFWSILGSWLGLVAFACSPGRGRKITWVQNYLG